MSVISKGIQEVVKLSRKSNISPVKVWKFPENGKSYILAADPCLGNDGGDNAAIQVIEVETGEQCAEFADKVSPESLAPMILDLAKIYNNAEVAVETNSFGRVINSILLRKLEYGNLYYSKRLDRLKHEMTDIVGWWTDYKTKERMESSFREFFGLRPELIHSKKLLDEILAYNEEEPKSNDRFMAIMIALAVRSERILVAA